MDSPRRDMAVFRYEGNFGGKRGGNMLDATRSRT